MPGTCPGWKRVSRCRSGSWPAPCSSSMVARCRWPQCTTPPMPQPVDWLARKVGGVIDFRLPDDPHHIPADVMTARIGEYYDQLWKASGWGKRHVKAVADSGGVSAGRGPAAMADRPREPRAGVRRSDAARGS